MADSKKDDPAQDDPLKTDGQTPDDTAPDDTVADDTVAEDAKADGSDTTEARDAEDTLAEDAAPAEGTIHTDAADAAEAESTEVQDTGDATAANPWARDDADMQGDDTTHGTAADDTLDTGDSPLAAEAEDSVGADTPDTAPAATAPPPERIVEKRGGALPMILGGVVAAGLGFAAATLGEGRLPFLPEPGPSPFEQEAQAALDTQADRLETIAQGLEGLQGTVDGIDTSSLSDAISALDARVGTLAGTQSDLEARVAAIDERLTALERAPVEEAVSPEAIAAYEREIEALRQSVADSRAEIEAIAEQARQSENSAARQAELAESRAALADVAAALQAGQGYADAVATLSQNGVSVPDTLASAADEGIPTPAQLVSEFPAAARAALRVARAETDPAEEGGLGGFLRSQLNARSVTPRDGDDPDAILSRAEAAVQVGDLETALSEIDALPEAARAEMAEWAEMARTRAEALAATGSLARELNE